MSATGIFWTQDPNHEYGYGAGRAHPCVKHITCQICGMKPGVLCTGRYGPVFDTHYDRRKQYKILMNTVKSNLKPNDRLLKGFK